MRFLNRHVVTAVVAGSGLIASVILAFKAGSKAERILAEKYPDKDYEPTLKEKAEVILPEAVPAMVAAAGTVAAAAVEVTGMQREANVLKGKVQEYMHKSEKIGKSFGKYREALIKTDGKEKDDALRVAASTVEFKSEEEIAAADAAFQVAAANAGVKIDENGEVMHRFRIAWLDKVVCFWSTRSTVYKGFAHVNKLILDTSQGLEKAYVSDFMEYIDQRPVITDEMYRKGWSKELLEMGDSAYWVDFSLYDKPDEGLIDIIVESDPWEDNDILG